MQNGSVERTLATLFYSVFSRGWSYRAPRVLGIGERHLFKICAGEVPLSRRHKRILETYARNRANAASSEIKAAEARARRKAQADLARLEQARQTIRSLLKESG